MLTISGNQPIAPEPIDDNLAIALCFLANYALAGDDLYLLAAGYFYAQYAQRVCRPSAKPIVTQE